MFNRDENNEKDLNGTEDLNAVSWDDILGDDEDLELLNDDELQSLPDESVIELDANDESAVPEEFEIVNSDGPQPFEDDIDLNDFDINDDIPLQENEVQTEISEDINSGETSNFSNISQSETAEVEENSSTIQTSDMEKMFGEPTQQVNAYEQQMPDVSAELDDKDLVIEIQQTNEYNKDLNANAGVVGFDDSFNSDEIEFGDDSQAFDDVTNDLLNPDKKRKSKIPLVLALLLSFLVAAGVCAFLYFGNSIPFLANQNQDIAPNSNSISQNAEQDFMEVPTQLPSDASVNEPVSPASKALNAPKQEVSKNTQTTPQNDKVVLEVVNTGRSNPFKPIPNFNNAGYTVPGNLDVFGPPMPPVEDPELAQLVEIVVSGILYDNVKPSAIITVGGMDYFVQKGDTVDKFIVSEITPTKVVIRNGKNVFSASIGQEFDINGPIAGQTKYSYDQNQKRVTRHYVSPSEVEVNIKK